MNAFWERGDPEGLGTVCLNAGPSYSLVVLTVDQGHHCHQAVDSSPSHVKFQEEVKNLGFRGAQKCVPPQ